MHDSDYSPFSKLSLAASLFGVLSFAGLAAPEFVLLPVAGLACGAAGLIGVRKYGLRGRGAAKWGILLSAVWIVVTPSWHIVRFGLEATPGYERVDFRLAARNGQAGLDRLAGRHVCLKGYSLYSMQSTNEYGMDSFLLSVDGNWKTRTPAVLVKLPPGESWQWDGRGIAVSGTLMRNPDADENDPKSPKFVLQNCTVRRSLTRSGIANDVGDC